MLDIFLMTDKQQQQRLTKTRSLISFLAKVILVHNPFPYYLKTKILNYLKCSLKSVILVILLINASATDQILGFTSVVLQQNRHLTVQ